MVFHSLMLLIEGFLFAVTIGDQFGCEESSNEAETHTESFSFACPRLFSDIGYSSTANNRCCCCCCCICCAANFRSYKHVYCARTNEQQQQ